jgi:hypothetical protein
MSSYGMQEDRYKKKRTNKPISWVRLFATPSFVGLPVWARRNPGRRAFARRLELKGRKTSSINTVPNPAARIAPRKNVDDPAKSRGLMIRNAPMVCLINFASRSLLFIGLIHEFHKYGACVRSDPGCAARNQTSCLSSFSVTFLLTSSPYSPSGEALRPRQWDLDKLAYSLLLQSDPTPVAWPHQETLLGSGDTTCPG